MIEWLKNFFNPKNLLKQSVDALDLAVPFLASEITKVEVKFKSMDPNEKAQWIIDNLQAFLRKRFSLDA